MSRLRPSWTVLVLCLALVPWAAAAPSPAPKRPPLLKRGPRAWGNAAQEGGSRAADLAGVGTNRLLAHAVSDSSFKQYAGPVRAFLYDAKQLGCDLSSVPALDTALANYLDDICFIKRLGFAYGSKTYSGLMNLAPELKGRCPRAARALMSWQRLANSSEGGPIPSAALGLLVRHFIDEGRFVELYAALLAEDGFLRESDWESVAGCDVLCHEVPGGVPRVALRLGSGARGLSTKTGPDHGVLIEGEFVRWWTWFLAEQTDAKAKLVPIDQIAFRRAWQRAWAALGLDMGPPHSLRHSGPARAVLEGTMDLESIRRRGRWQSLKSVQRYTKTQLLL